jgi:glycerol-3-phosphate O-acyltransferase
MDIIIIKKKQMRTYLFSSDFSTENAEEVFALQQVLILTGYEISNQDELVNRVIRRSTLNAIRDYAQDKKLTREERGIKVAIIANEDSMELNEEEIKELDQLLSPEFIARINKDLNKFHRVIGTVTDEAGTPTCR